MLCDIVRARIAWRGEKSVKFYRLGANVATIVALAAAGTLAVAMAAQNQSAVPASSLAPQAAAAPNVPIWAYPVSPPRPGAGRGPNAGGGANAASPAPAANRGGASGAQGAGRGPGRAPDDGSLRRVPGSDVGLTQTQIRSNGMFGFPDWFPNTHPNMPDIVSKGNSASGVQACSYCHLPNGQGRPENESIAGLPAGYILQQLSDFGDGDRKGTDPRMGYTFMTRIGKAISPEDAKTAADYWAAQKLKPWIRVIETDTVPVTRPQGGMLVTVDGGGTEPIGERVIEVSEDLERTELRDPTSGFVAYVPKGSLAKGKELVMTGGSGKSIRCTLCHGTDLKGLGNVPSIAGRSPSQMARQIIDIQSGARNGPWSQLMKEPVRQLTNDDIVNVVSYLASLEP
jgi:cytochrome c553